MKMLPNKLVIDNSYKTGFKTVSLERFQTVIDKNEYIKNFYSFRFHHSKIHKNSGKSERAMQVEKTSR